MRRFHYAWLICAGGTVMLFTSIGLGVNVFSVFQPHLMQFAGLTNTQASFITTTRSLFMLLGMMSAGALADKIGLRRICTLSMLMLTAISSSSKNPMSFVLPQKAMHKKTRLLPVFLCGTEKAGKSRHKSHISFAVQSQRRKPHCVDSAAPQRRRLLPYSRGV